MNAAWEDLRLEERRAWDAYIESESRFLAYNSLENVEAMHDRHGEWRRALYRLAEELRRAWA